MEKIGFVLSLILFFTVSLAHAEFHGGGGGNFGGGGGFSGGGSSDFHTSAVVSPQLRSMGVRNVPHYSFSNRAGFLNSTNRYSMGVPAMGARGNVLHSTLVAPRAMSSYVVRNNMAMVNTPGFRANIIGFNSRENVVGRYYWHNYNGLSYCHYYDRWGCNWYGWYCGPSFYWSCWFGNYWWWYDPSYYRWCYWYDGWWWWQDPDNVTVTYVYNNGQYIPEQAEASQPADNGVAAPAQDDLAVNNDSTPMGIVSFPSKDKTRMVKLVGSSNDAFLSDTSATPTFKAKYLASGVQNVKYARVAGALQITLVMKDGTKETFDANGEPVN